jgi:multimeric flavodoxin WrbA
MKVLIINSSHRFGNTDIVVNRAIDELKKFGCETYELKLRDIEMKLPDGCEDCADGGICPNVKDKLSEEIEPTLRGYDRLILATPTWSDNVTPLMNIFWNRIVSWCHDERKYLKNKKIFIITHGMAGENSWKHVIDWVKSVCVWEEADFGGSLTFSSSGKVGDIEIDYEQMNNFILKVTK